MKLPIIIRSGHSNHIFNNLNTLLMARIEYFVEVVFFWLENEQGATKSEKLKSPFDFCKSSRYCRCPLGIWGVFFPAFVFLTFRLVLSLCWLCFFAAFDFQKLMSIPADNGHSSGNSVSALFANNELVLAIQIPKCRLLTSMGIFSSL